MVYNTTLCMCYTVKHTAAPHTTQHRVGCSCIPYSTWRPYSAHPTATPSSPGPGGTKVFSKPSSLDIRPLSTLGGAEEGRDEIRGRGWRGEKGKDRGKRRERGRRVESGKRGGNRG